MIAKEVMSQDYIQVDIKSTLSELLGKLKLRKEKGALLFDGKQYKGIFSKHRMIKTKLDPNSIKVDKMLKHVPALTGNEELKEAARLLIAGNCQMIPVISKGKVLGVVKALDVVEHLDVQSKKKKVIEAATLEPVMVYENDGIAKAIEIMHRHAIDRLPMVDNQGNLLNIVSLTDLMENYFILLQKKSETRGSGLTSAGPRTIRAYRAKRPEINNLPIKNFTSPIIITVHEDEIVGNVIGNMKEYEIGSVVVVRGRRVVGIVTVHDLLKLFLK